MSEEQKKEIVKSNFYGYSVSEIANLEDISETEVLQAIAWGEQSGYKAELEERQKEVYDS